MANADGVTLLAFLKNEADIAAMKAFAGLHHLGEDTVFEGDIRDAASHLADHEPPNLLIVEIPGMEGAQELLNQLADVCAPDTKVVIAGHINEYSFFLWLQEIGIFHYLLLPLKPEMLESLYQKITTAGSVAGGAAKTPGKTVGIIGTRGGSGATCLSILLGGLMAEYMKKDTCVVELDPLDGTAALLLDLEPSRGFREAIEKPDRIDELFLERVMIKLTPHLSLISAEENLNANVQFSPEAAEALIPAMKERFAYSFIDISHHFNPFSLKAACLCDHLLVISPMNLQGLRDSMRINDWLKEKCGITHQLFIGNKVGEMPKHEVIQADFEKSLGTKLSALIPFSPELFSEITSDLAVIKKTKVEGFDALVSLAQIIQPSLKIGEETNKKDKKSGLKALKKK